MAKQSPIVSIITPTYNHESFIGFCIESVLAQTYPNWEMFIIDDGSTDRTGEVVALYKDDRIKYIRQDNKGIARLSEIYNVALSQARGDFIAILEGDDYWPHYKLKLQVAAFDDKEVVLSFGHTQIVGPDGMPLGLIPNRKLPDEAKTNTPVGRAGMYMMSPTFLTFTFPVSVLIRKSALEHIGGFHQPSYLPIVDYPTFLQLTLEGKFAFHKEILGFWRRHGESVTKSKFPLILDGVSKYIQTFRTDRGTYFPILPEEYLRLDTEWNRMEATRWFVLGRWHLKDGEWEEARRAFQKGLSYRCGYGRHLALFIGIIFSFIHLDMEFLFRLIRRPDLEEMLSEEGKDPIVSKENNVQ